MLKVDLVENYVLTADAHNFILNVRLVAKDGKSKGLARMEAIGFYPTLAQALQGCVTQKMRRSSAKTAKALLREHQEVVGQLQNIFQELS